MLDVADQFEVEHTFGCIVVNKGALNMLARPPPWQRLKSSFYAGLQRTLRASRAFQEQRAQVEHAYSYFAEKFGAEALAQLAETNMGNYPKIMNIL